MGEDLRSPRRGRAGQDCGSRTVGSGGEPGDTCEDSGAGKRWGVEVTCVAGSACLCCCWAGEAEASGLGGRGE